MMLGKQVEHGCGLRSVDDIEQPKGETEKEKTKKNKPIFAPVRVDGKDSGFSSQTFGT